MNLLTELLGEHEFDIQYPNIADVEYDDKGKPKQSWMKNWTQEERTEKFFEFCREYDLRRDSLLRDNYQQFSHRMHWHECPFVDEIKEVDDFKQYSKHVSSSPLAMNTGKLLRRGNQVVRKPCVLVLYLNVMLAQIFFKSIIQKIRV